MKAESVTVEPVPCTVLSMAFFEKLNNDKVVRSDTGNIVKCFDEYFEDFTVSDELRKVWEKIWNISSIFVCVEYSMVAI